jgi:hypothetical protein
MTTTQSEIDDLIAQMTLTEKAGQLTQYFYFRLPQQPGVEPALHVDRDKQPLEVESALGRGGVGPCCLSPIRQRSTACSGWPSMVTGSASRHSLDST